MYIKTPKDLVGRFYGKLQVKEYLGKRRHCHFYKVQCRCGTIEEVERFRLKSIKRWCIPCSTIKTKSKLVDTAADYVGTKIGELTVIEYVGKDRASRQCYIVQCGCGTKERVYKSLLQSKRRCINCQKKKHTKQYHAIVHHLLNNLDTDVEVI
jgi:hypothetical protein